MRRVSVFDGHRHSQGQQFFPAEWKADQLKNILLGRDDQIGVSRRPVDLLPILRGVAMVICEFEHINDLPLPFMNDPIKRLRIRNARDGYDLPARQ